MLEPEKSGGGGTRGEPRRKVGGVLKLGQVCVWGGGPATTDAAAAADTSVAMQEELLEEAQMKLSEVLKRSL